MISMQIMYIAFPLHCVYEVICVKPIAGFPCSVDSCIDTSKVKCRGRQQGKVQRTPARKSAEDASKEKCRGRQHKHKHKHASILLGMTHRYCDHIRVGAGHFHHSGHFPGDLSSQKACTRMRVTVRVHNNAYDYARAQECL